MHNAKNSKYTNSAKEKTYEFNIVAVCLLCVRKLYIAKWYIFSLAMGKNKKHDNQCFSEAYITQL